MDFLIFLDEIIWSEAKLKELRNKQNSINSLIRSIRVPGVRLFFRLKR